MPQCFAPTMAPMPAQAEAPGAISVLKVRRADTFLRRLAGLLAMAPLQSGEGLLLAPCASVHTAFMRYAIDVVFLDRAGVIQKIVPTLKPWRMAACVGAYQTLELAAGQAGALRLSPGQRWPELGQQRAHQHP
ncbi:MAG: DUF192 domain-containing protein [Rhodoferax sp.]|nr:DUF192 domain-containing protein [Rhodoferax sp.]